MKYYMSALIVICGTLIIILIVGFTIAIKEKIDYYRARQRQRGHLTNKNRAGKV